MRYFLVVVAAAVFLATGAPAARAQGTFPLKYVLAEENDPLTSGHGTTHWVEATTQKPGEIKTLPQGVSPDKVRYFSIRLGDRCPRIPAVLDLSSSPPNLYVDLEGKGDLSAAKPMAGKAVGDTKHYSFGLVDLKVGNGADIIGGKIRLVSINDNQWLGAQPGGYRTGTVTLDGQTYRVAVVDKNMNGRYETVSLTNGNIASWYLANWMALDFNQDGKFTGEPGWSDSEIQPLLKAVHVGNKYYRVEVAADGSSLKMEKCEPKTGTLDIGTAAASLVLLSDTGVHNLKGSGGKWEVPEGNYVCTHFVLTKADANSRERRLDGLDKGPLAKFEIRAGNTTRFEIGPPLTLMVEATGPDQGRIVLDLALVGKGGETYPFTLVWSGLLVPPAPKVKIFDASGKVLSEGNLEYG